MKLISILLTVCILLHVNFAGGNIVRLLRKNFIMDKPERQSFDLTGPLINEGGQNLGNLVKKMSNKDVETFIDKLIQDVGPWNAMQISLGIMKRDEVARHATIKRDNEIDDHAIIKREGVNRYLPSKRDDEIGRHAIIKREEVTNKWN